MSLQNYRVNIENFDGSVIQYIAISCRFDGMTQFHHLEKKDVPEGKIPVLFCRCGSKSFTRNGRDLNEYECPCCGEFAIIEIE